MLGFALGGLSRPRPPVAVAPAPAVRAETAALLARMTPPAPPQRASVIDALIAALVDAGIWSRIDRLLLFAAHSPQAALLDWKGGGDAGFGGGAPRHIADRGYWVDGHDDWIDPGFVPAAAVQFQRSSAMLGIWGRKSDRNPASPVGTITGTTISLNPRASSDVSAGRLNGSAVVTGGTVTTGYGLVVVDRPGSGTLRHFIDGVLKGENTNASASNPASVQVGIGRANAVTVDGQFCAFVAGGTLTAAQHAVLHQALRRYMDALGVAPLPAVVATTRAVTEWSTLPDGSAPIGTERGMAVTGLARDLAGRWYVGNGRTTRHPLLFTRLSPDRTMIEAEFDLTRLGLSADMAGSCQGITLDRSDGHLWMLVKLSGPDGGASHLVRFDPASETVSAPPIALAGTANGIAHDPVADCLWVVHDTGELVAYDRSGTIRSGGTPLPANADQCVIADRRYGDIMTGELLVTAGANGAAGTIHRYRRLDYGGWVLVAVDTLDGADAIEGVWIDDDGIWIGNDGATHTGAPRLNRIGRYSTDS